MCLVLLVFGVSSVWLFWVDVLLGFLVNVVFWLFDLVFMRFVWFGWFIDLAGLFAFQFALAGCGLGVVLLLVVVVSMLVC